MCSFYSATNLYAGYFPFPPFFAVPCVEHGSARFAMDCAFVLFERVQWFEHMAPPADSGAVGLRDAVALPHFVAKVLPVEGAYFVPALGVAFAILLGAWGHGLFMLLVSLSKWSNGPWLLRVR